MDDMFSLASIDMQRLQTADELRECNDLTAQFGLYLSEYQIQDLAAKRFAALKESGRVEFGQGVLRKLIDAFCDSAYISQRNYAELIAALQDIFYNYKNESAENIPDDELISRMRVYFDQVCQGSLEFLYGTSLDKLCECTVYITDPTDHSDENRY